MADTSWYFTRQEIEENSPSRLDGMDFKEESFQRWSYSTFLQELGQKLKNPQTAIATSIIYCQRFFTRESLVKNDAKIVSIICMFIAGKGEESPRPVGEVVAVGYRILHNKEPSREVYERLKKTVLTGEKFVLSTLGFDLKIEHPFELVTNWVKKSVKVERDANRLSQAALNFINDGLRSSLYLQFRPSQIAAAAIYLGSSLAKVKLPLDGEKVWWEEFNVTKSQIGDICDQTLDIYKQDFLKPVKREAETKVGDAELAREEKKQRKDDLTKSFQGGEDHQDHKGSVINEADKSRVAFETNKDVSLEAFRTRHGL